MQRRRLASFISFFTVVPATAFAAGPEQAAKAPQLSYGDPIAYQSITLIPVMTDDPGPFRKYTLLEEGVSKRTFQVRELAGNADEASVAEIEVRNRGTDPVFLLGGEMILGGKQDRIIQSDTVVSADAKWHKVAVFCVEQGRWQGQKMDFQGGGAIAHLKLQEAAMTGQQGKVWEEVARKNAEQGTTSDTQTYRRTIQNAKIRAKIAKYRSELEKLLPSKPIAGMIFAINGEIQVADVFGNPVLYSDLREKLLSAYILEALEHQVDPKAKPVEAKMGKDFLDEAQAAPSIGTKMSGNAKTVQKRSDKSLSNETYDDENGKPIRSTYFKTK